MTSTSANPLKVVVLSGAGISAESGLSTFRGAGGLWQQHRFEDLASPEGFARDPQLVLDFYNQRRRDAWAAEPNAVGFVGTYNGGGGPAYYDWVRVSD